MTTPTIKGIAGALNIGEALLLADRLRNCADWFADQPLMKNMSADDMKSVSSDWLEAATMLEALAGQRNAVIESVGVTDFFSENVDKWGAAQWFDRLAKAVRERGKAVIAGDDVSFEICQNVASSSATRLVCGFEETVRAALSNQPQAEPVAWRVEDFTDGWFLFHTKEEAKLAVKGLNRIEPLYVAAPSHTPTDSEPR